MHGVIFMGWKYEVRSACFLGLYSIGVGGRFIMREVGVITIIYCSVRIFYSCHFNSIKSHFWNPQSDGSSMCLRELIDFDVNFSFLFVRDDFLLTHWYFMIRSFSTIRFIIVFSLSISWNFTSFHIWIVLVFSSFPFLGLKLCWIFICALAMILTYSNFKWMTEVSGITYLFS